MSETAQITIPRLCIFAGASFGLDARYADETRRLGSMLGARDFRFVYGGGRTGLMGSFASGALEAGGHVTGIIPKFLETLEVGNKAVQELIVVDDMHTRKAMMYKGTDAFIVLPGGLGTLDEMMEVLTWNQLGIINAPVHILNISGYWDHVVGMLHHATEEGFVHSKGLLHFSVADNADDLVDNLERQMADRSS